MRFIKSIRPLFLDLDTRGFKHNWYFGAQFDFKKNQYKFVLKTSVSESRLRTDAYTKLSGRFNSYSTKM